MRILDYISQQNQEECLILLNKHVSFLSHLSKFDFNLQNLYFKSYNLNRYHAYISYFEASQLQQINNDKDVVWIKCQKGIKSIILGEINPTTKKGEDVTVYLIDSKINHQLSIFEGRISNLDLFGMCSSNKILDDHGTAVASIITGAKIGTSKAKIIGLNNNKQKEKRITEKLYLKACQDSKYKKSLINLSGGYKKLNYHNILLPPCPNSIVVTSAGNEKQSTLNNRYLLPGDSIVVGAVDELGQKYTTSNYGAVDIYCLGVNIEVALQNGDIKITNGTSASSAYITAILSIILSQSRFPLDLKAALKILLYFSDNIEQYYDDSKYSGKEGFKKYIPVLYDKFTLNQLRIFGQLY